MSVSSPVENLTDHYIIDQLLAKAALLQMHDAKQNRRQPGDDDQ